MKPYLQANGLTIYQGDCRAVLRELPAESVHCVITSPPYWGLRDYGVAGQIGLEATPEEYVANLVDVFREVRRVLHPTGTCWLNLGDSYAANRTYQVVDNKHIDAGNNHGSTVPVGLKPKDLIGIPWRVAFALQADGWWLRSDIIWHKPNPMPESVTDRPTKAHEYIFLLSKAARYYYDAEAIKEGAQTEPHNSRYVNGEFYAVGPMDRGGHSQREDPERVWARDGRRNRRSVWTIATQPFSGWTETVRWQRVARGDVSDGMMHIASPDCPVHGCLGRSCDGRGDGELNHSERTFHHPDEAQEHEHVCSSRHPASLSLTDSWDSDRLECVPSAIPHNNGSHRTDLALVTTQPCMPCAEIDAHTGDTSKLRECDGPQSGTPDCNTLPDVMDAHSLDQIEHHIVRKSSLPIPPDCSCAFYQKHTEKTSHFATFPEALVEPCILAGTSERGCCPECGAPWVRVVEKQTNWKERRGAGAWAGNIGVADNYQNNVHGKGMSHDLGTVALVDLGWRPTCQHNYEPVPCVVLDPFSGSGTTGRVAIKHRRRYIGIELKADYIELDRADNTQMALGVSL